MVFAAGLAGAKGRPLEQSQSDQARQMMVDAIRDGGVSQFASYDAAVAAVVFE